MKLSLIPCQKPLLYTVAAAAAAVALAGCGGGSSSTPFAFPSSSGSAPASAPAPALEQAPAPTPVNKAPVSNAGVKQSTTTGTTVTLDGSASTDPDGDSLTYAWTLVSKPAGSATVLAGADTVKPTFVPDVVGTYVVSLVVNDGKVSSEPTKVEVTTDEVAFDSLPAKLPPNMPSYGLEAMGLTAGVGDHIALKPGSPRLLKGISVAMSSWACESGTGNALCSSSPKSDFKHPITIRIYDDGANLIATHTQNFAVPYRPSADPTCANVTQWKAEDGKCYNGFAFKIAFDLGSLKVTLPDTFSYEVAYNTRTYGTPPIGQSGGYDSLNVGTYASPAVSPSVGSDPEPGFVRLNGTLMNDGTGIMAQVVVGAP